MRLRTLPTLLCAAMALAAGRPWPSTVPEATDHARTSTVAEVRAFMDALRRRDPALVPYQPKGAPRTTEAGTDFPARSPANAPIRSSIWRIRLPSSETSTSPSVMPAASAGLFGSTEISRSAVS